MNFHLTWQLLNFVTAINVFLGKNFILNILKKILWSTLLAIGNLSMSVVASALWAIFCAKVKFYVEFLGLLRVARKNWISMLTAVKIDLRQFQLTSNHFSTNKRLKNYAATPLGCKFHKRAHFHATLDGQQQARSLFRGKNRGGFRYILVTLAQFPALATLTNFKRNWPRAANTDRAAAVAGKPYHFSPLTTSNRRFRSVIVDSYITSIVAANGTYDTSAVYFLVPAIVRASWEYCGIVSDLEVNGTGSRYGYGFGAEKVAIVNTFVFKTLAFALRTIAVNCQLLWHLR